MQAMVESPRGCLQQNSQTCYFGSVSKIIDYQVNDQVLIHIGKDSVLEKTAGVFSFHVGEIIIVVPSEFRLKIKNAQIDFIKGEYYIKNQLDSFVVRTLEGEAKVEISPSQDIQVTEGFDLALLAGVNGGFEPAPLKVIPLEEQLVVYSKLKRLNKRAIVKYTQTFSKRHENYRHWALELNDKLMQRQIAADEVALQQRKAKEQLRKSEQERVRRLLFEKAFER